MARFDLIHEVKSAGAYQCEFLLWRHQWDNYPNLIPLEWKCVKFERENRTQIPNSKGIYAFFVEPQIANFPSHGYLMYIGESGQDSNRNLRKRFGDYFSEKKGANRVTIEYMLNLWEGYLYFYYAEVDLNQMDLKELEKILLDTFTPPFSERGFSAKIKDVVKIVRH